MELPISSIIIFVYIILNNINKYDGFGKVKRICEDALSSVGLPINDRFMRIAKRLFYKYDKHEITSIYKY